MRFCPVTLEPLANGETHSKAGLRSLHPRLNRLEPLALGQEEQLRQARLRADKMSIQGVQPKLSAVLKPREGRNQRLHVEDFAQLSGATRDTKYDSSLEQIAKLVESHCTFPAVEKAELARRLLFCFLIGNEDMHLKNFSLMVLNERVRLAPAYDLLNSTLVLENASEETALPLRGRKRKLTREDWLDYLCRERLDLPEPILQGILTDLHDGLPGWKELVRRSCLSESRQDRYLEILEERHRRLFPLP